MTYNWQQKDWPHFSYKIDNDLQYLMLRYAWNTGFISGFLISAPEDIKIFEEKDEYKEIAPYIQEKLKLSKEPTPPQNLRAENILKLITEIKQSYKKPLSERLLLDWHTQLFSGLKNQTGVGQWATKPRTVKDKNNIIHFQAPPAEQKQTLIEIERFINWFNETAPRQKKAIIFPLVRSSIAYLYFVSIHPFGGGNGRIGRAIAEKAVWQGFNCSFFPFSISQLIEAKKNDENYCQALKKAQCSNEVSAWIKYFSNIILEAQEKIISTMKFWARAKRLVNERQLKAISYMLKEELNGLNNNMSAQKYTAITKTSKATATRDLTDLTDKKILQSSGSGRSTVYLLNINIPVDCL